MLSVKKRIISGSVQQTRQIGEQLGSHCRGGEVIELISDLGGGKTTLVHGLAKGIGSPDHVASPTFTISRLYKGGRLEVYHFDFYRLQDAGLMEFELQDVLGDPKAIVVIEWGDVVGHVLPQERLSVRLTSTAEEMRRFDFEYPEPLAYLVEEL